MFFRSLKGNVKALLKLYHLPSQKVAENAAWFCGELWKEIKTLLNIACKTLEQKEEDAILRK